MAECVLHLLERIAQLSDLVVMLQLGQRCIEITLRHLVGRLCQLTQWTCSPLGDKLTDKAHHQQCEAYQYHKDDTKNDRHNIDHDSRHHKTNRPIGMVNRHVSQIDINIFHVEKFEMGLIAFFITIDTLLSCHHLTTYIFANRIVGLFGQLEIIFPDGIRAVRMGNKRTVVIDDESITTKSL